ELIKAPGEPAVAQMLDFEVNGGVSAFGVNYVVGRESGDSGDTGACQQGGGESGANNIFGAFHSELLKLNIIYQTRVLTYVPVCDHGWQSDETAQPARADWQK